MKKILLVLVCAAAGLPAGAQAVDSAARQLCWDESVFNTYFEAVVHRAQSEQPAFSNLTPWNRILLAAEPLRPVERQSNASLEEIRKGKKPFQLPTERSSFYMLWFNASDKKNYAELVEAVKVFSKADKQNESSLENKLLELYQSDDNFKFPLIVLAAKACGLSLSELHKTLEAEEEGENLPLKLRRYQALNVLEGNRIDKVRGWEHLAVIHTLRYLEKNK